MRTNHKVETGSRRSGAGFSLVELLTVIAIISLLAVMVVPAVSGISRGYQLTAAGHVALNTLVQARQVAITRGYPVQVRFYKLPAYGQPDTAAPSVFRAMQIFIEGDPIVSGGAVQTPVTAVGKAAFFGAPVEILASQSSLLTLPINSSPQETLPGYAKNYQYVSFHFKPNGQADLPPTASGFTLVSAGGSPGTSLPANFRALEIDPTTGVARDYSP